ncbi:hypothetical protein ALT_9643 [Aspergillus lentulus]|uniref:Rhodopsin domain-containing protein n=1 Tax=Aspergillus lentulus TaxID=293939 RepID=A0AAN4PTH3_ASPLE|nr:hypothetical protein ALT_9643 [Aspergillus lentulus]
MVTKSPFITEAAIEFSLAIFVLILRLISRWHLVGFRGWGIDDYLCILAALFVTYLMIPIFLVGQTLNSNIGWTPEQRATFSHEEIGQMQITAKLVIAGWFAYAGALWSLKGAVLIYYNRIMCGVAQQRIIRVTGVYCGLSFIAVVLAIFLRCRPFEKLWQIYRDPGLECSSYYTLYIIVAVLNVTTDMLLVYIPIPVLIHLRITIYQKVVVGILLCSGVFIIVAALLRCVMSLLEISQINSTAVWTVREIFVAFVAVNSPAIKPLFNPSSWKRLPKVVDASVKHTSHTQARIVLPQNNGSFDAYPPTLQPPAPSVHTLSGISHSDRSTDWDISPQAPNIRFPEQALYDYV